jgi:hypothetical protein
MIDYGPAVGLSPPTVQMARRMMLPTDMALLVDVRLLSVDREVARVFATNTLPGLANADRQSSLSMSLETYLKTMIVEPMVKDVQTLVQQTLLAEEMRLDNMELPTINLGMAFDAGAPNATSPDAPDGDQASQP